MATKTKTTKEPTRNLNKNQAIAVSPEKYDLIKNSAILNNRSLFQETDSILSDFYGVKRKEVDQRIAEDNENHKIISYLKDFHSPSWKRWIPVIDELIISSDSEMPVEVFHTKCKYMGPIQDNELLFLLDRLQFLYDGQIKHDKRSNKIIKLRPVKYKLSNLVWNYHVLRGTGATIEEIVAVTKSLLRVGSNLPVYQYTKETKLED